MKTFLPCRSETDCGYNEQIEIIVPYFARATHLDIERGYSFRLVNPARYNMQELFENPHAAESYCQLFAGGCSPYILQVREKEAPEKLQ